MEPSSTRQRHVSFYLEAMSGHQSLPVPLGGQLQVMDSPGHSIGTFPREPGEDYSWYLCPCQRDPAAWRVRGPADFHCKLCNAVPEALMVCTCGIVSVVAGPPACGWCGSEPHATSHSCRSAGGRSIFFDRPECPLCGSAPAPSAPPLPVAPARAAESPAEASPPPREPLPLPLASSALTHLADNAGARPLATRPVAAGPVAASAAAPQAKRSSATVRLARLILLVVIGACLAWTLSQWSFRASTYGRALAALEHGDPREPPGGSAIGPYEELARAEPGSARVQNLGRRIAALLRPWADAQLQRFSAESADDTPWPQLAASYAFLVRTAPQDREAQARQRYCTAQVAFGRGEYQEALNGFQAALDLHPQWALAWNGRGRVHVHAAPPLRDYESARREYLAAHQADPQFIYPLVNLAGLALLLHQTGEAPGYLRQAIDIRPQEPKLYYELGHAFVLLHQRREAIGAYEECLRYVTDPAQRAKVESDLRKLGVTPAVAAGAAP